MTVYSTTVFVILYGVRYAVHLYFYLLLRSLLQYDGAFEVSKSVSAETV